MATRDDVNETIRLMLATGTSKAIGLIDPPSATPSMPYGILMPRTISSGTGSMDKIEEEHDWLFDVINVGNSGRMAAAMSTKTFTVMTAMLGSSYVHPIVLAGAEVQWRLSDSRGAIVRSGETLFQCVDSYRIRVGPS